MADMPWSKFFWADWESDQALRLSSLAAQGLWMRMLCVCARSEPFGYLAINDRPLDSSDVARLAGILPDEAGALMDELDRNGVFSRDRKGRIYSRRLVRDRKRSDEGRKHVKKRWEQPPENSAENPEPNRPPTRSPKTQKPEARVQNKGSPPDGFDAFWAECLRKVKKPEAMKAYARAIGRASPETILEGMRRYSAAKRGAELQFIAHPASWLNNDRWQDEEPSQSTQTSEEDDAQLRRWRRIAGR